MQQVKVSDLTPEAQATLQQIQSRGSFSYPQDGSVFKNLEKKLPVKPSNYYREYTVETPGSLDRGARRIVMGQGGGIYYTNDHYNSFQEVLMTP
ncbi:ribonuclease domain-containing protein [Leptolyngbya sp. AN03gr2]|uniref:ribonuclease domain-containing protein n=1 Tax=unclassified Leptolyngbya TaxID=2650499 RepID=UPI003D31C3E9